MFRFSFLLHGSRPINFRISQTNLAINFAVCISSTLLPDLLAQVIHANANAIRQPSASASTSVSASASATATATASFWPNENGQALSRQLIKAPLARPQTNPFVCTYIYRMLVRQHSCSNMARPGQLTTQMAKMTARPIRVMSQPMGNGNMNMRWPFGRHFFDRSGWRSCSPTIPCQRPLRAMPVY